MKRVHCNLVASEVCFQQKKGETNMEVGKGAIRDSSTMDISLTSTALEATNNNQINIELN